MHFALTRGTFSHENSNFRLLSWVLGDVLGGIMDRRKFIHGAGAFLATCPTCIGATSALGGVSVSSHWSYGGKDGPAHWGELSSRYSVCAAGTQQSPIDLTAAVSARLAPVEVAYKAIRPRVVNNGHTIQVNCDPGSGIHLDGEAYALLQFHFHHPSEHLIDGKSRAMEVHFVHQSKKGGLAVLGVMIRPGAENRVLAPIWAAMPQKAGPEVAAPGPVNQVDLLPGGGIYRYQGSLTTPPCSEIVVWTVYKRSVEASPAQIAAFSKLFPMNARPALKPHRRYVLESD